MRLYNEVVLQDHLIIQNHEAEMVKRIEGETDLICGISILISQDLEPEFHLESCVSPKKLPETEELQA